MKSILDPSFKYVPACSTDIRKTFERVRAEQAEAQAALAIEQANRAADTTRILNIFDARRKEGGHQ